jgi:hypothetical protein
MTRDLTSLADFGITAPKIAALKALGDAFEVFPSDEVYLGEIMTLVTAKNAIIEQVKESVRNMSLRVALKWGYDSGQYKSLGIYDMNVIAEDALLTCARRVHLLCTEWLVDLTPFGLTQPLLDAFEDLNESFEVAMNDVSSKKSYRDDKAKERVEKGNEIYDLVSTYCDIGKRVFVKSDPVKYNDYIIYTFSPGVPGKIDNMMYESQTSKISWGSEPTATEYQLEFSPVTPQFTWLEVYRGPMTFFVHVLGPGQTVYRVRGINSNGYGYWSNNLLVTRI